MIYNNVVCWNIAKMINQQSFEVDDTKCLGCSSRHNGQGEAESLKMIIWNIAQTPKLCNLLIVKIINPKSKNS